MPSSQHVVSSPASTASTPPLALRRKRIDFVTGYCGLSPPSLLERIGTMAAEGQPAKTTPTSIASGPAERRDNRIRMTVDKPSSRPALHRAIRREPMSARAGPVDCGREKQATASHGRWLLRACAQSRSRRCASIPRHKTVTKHLTLRCPTFWPTFRKRDGSDPRRKNSVGPRPASRVLVSSVLVRVA